MVTENAGKVLGVCGAALLSCLSVRLEKPVIHLRHSDAVMVVLCDRLSCCFDMEKYITVLSFSGVKGGYLLNKIFTLESSSCALSVDQKNTFEISNSLNRERRKPKDSGENVFVFRVRGPSGYSAF